MTTETPTEQPRVPGVKYRLVKRQRMVETTIGGETRLTPQTYEEWEPVPPRNLDAIGLRAVVGLAVTMTTVSVVWSTASIGDQLSTVVLAAVAYGAATLFEATWIGLQLIEWLLRYEPSRAKPAQFGGWIALAVVVGSVITHGVEKDQVAAGVIGGIVSVLAKGLWVVVMRMFHVPLGEGAASFLQQKREELAVARVVLGEQQRLDGTQAYLTAVYGQQAAQVIEPARPVQAPELPAPPVAIAAPAAPVAPPVSAAPPVPAAPGLQHVPAPAIPVPSVATVAAPAAPAAPVAPAAPAPAAPAQQPAAAPAAPAPAPAAPGLQAVGGPSVAATIRKALAANPNISDEDLIAHVTDVHGPSRTYAETVPRTRRRIENPTPKKKRTA
ncbi:hypothetical protein [Kitasatospora aureofaciens]|uniref:hypothetical protein n=1 Tax=Kitasatospora aureofaciens TaxID=1894 RepID=UPI0033CACB59